MAEAFLPRMWKTGKGVVILVLICLFVWSSSTVSAFLPCRLSHRQSQLRHDYVVDYLQAQNSMLSHILERGTENSSTESDLALGTLTRRLCTGVLQPIYSYRASAREESALADLLANPTNGTLCSLASDGLWQLSQLPHGDGSSGPGSKRFLLNKTWLTLNDLRPLVRSSSASTVCVVVAANGIVPCLQRECLYQVHVRPNTSDMGVLDTVIERAEYEFVKDQSLETVLDAGGNIGIASLLFGLMWPNARIISIEPSSKNYEILQMNVGELHNVTPLHAGLWPRTAELVFVPNDRGAWGITVMEANESTSVEELKDSITGVNIPFLLDLFNLESFDFVKLDIEGAEEQVLAFEPGNDLSWLNQTRMLSAEFHERHNPGSSKPAKTTLFGNPRFKHSRYGEYEVFTRRD